MIQPERIQLLNAEPAGAGQYVLYWMQAAQRAEYNHALEYAVQEANRRRQPVTVVFGLTARYPEANLRHYVFMLQGLQEVQDALERRGIQFCLRLQEPDEAAIEMARNASLVVTDRGYLRGQQKWRKNVAETIQCPLVQVETDVVVPIEVVSDKEEYAAATIRKKIHRHLDRFLIPLDETPVEYRSPAANGEVVDLSDPVRLAGSLGTNSSVREVKEFKGGTARARQLLEDFIDQKLNRYAGDRSDPSLDCVSHMSPYLHFGQISPLYIALQVGGARRKRKNSKEAYLEELIVRRELSMNFVHFNSNYDSFDSLPDWALKTLRKHRRDSRKPSYSPKKLERAETDDPYWNAAQLEMVLTGKMHNYMRMYWGKKILEWSKSPEEAYRIALALNNKYELDGRDPNSFAGVAWCFGKHDRPWTERPIFGTVRYMNAAGLKRKFDIEAYVSRVAERAAEQ